MPKFTYEPEYIPTPEFKEKLNLHIAKNEALFIVESSKECQK
jgi:hypothetical protein